MTAHAKRAVGAGPQQDLHVRLLHGGVVVDVDDGDLGAALPARPHGVRHDVDLGVHRVGAPDDDAVGLGHFARIGAGEPPGAGDEAGPGEVGADRGVLAGIFLGVPQPIDAVAHDEAHRAGVVVGPDRFRPEGALGGEKFLRREVERLLPGNARELPGALGPVRLSGCVSRSGWWMRSA